MQRLTDPATAKGPDTMFTGEVWFDQIYRGSRDLCRVAPRAMSAILVAKEVLGDE
ncbi:MAG TPA: hypothetical protein VIW24_07435 [Aldersonia sp.]